MINKKMMLALLFMLPLGVFAQNMQSTNKLSISSRQTTRPKFNGDLKTYIIKNVKYPEKALENGIQGKCIVQFMVDEKGNIQRVENKKSSGDRLLDAEAERLIASMPAWKPGTYNKRPARYFYSLPIDFELQ